MKSFLFVALISLCGIQNAQTPNWVWAKSFGGASSEDGASITTDVNGDVYVAGYYFSPSIVFGSFTLTNAGNYDSFLVKYNSAGTVLWAKNVGGAFDEVTSGVATDLSGNIIITGYFSSASLVLGTNTLTNAGATDIFIIKYDPSGTLMWAKRAGDNGADNGNSIATDLSGNIYITGDFQSNTLIFGTYTLTSLGNSDIYLVKYDGGGNVQWAQSAGGNLLDMGNAVTVDKNGNPWFTGYFKSASISLGTFTFTNGNPGKSDVFTAKINSSTGAVLFADATGGNFDDLGSAITGDAGGNIFVTGYFASNTFTLGTNTFTNIANSGGDIFLVKYFNSGVVSWAKSAGGNFDDTGSGVAVDPAGNIYLCGHLHSSSAVFGNFTLTSSGVGDGYISKYDAAGNVQWVQNVGGISDDGSSCLTGDMAGNIYMSGFFFSNSISFGTYTLNNIASSDMFITKIGSTLGITNEILHNYSNILIYPNPTNGEFYLNGLSSEINIIGIDIFNCVGEKVYSATLPYRQNPINISGMPLGIYFMRIEDKNSVITKKIILN